MTSKQYLNIATELAKESGRIQLESLGHKHRVEFKGIADIVTEIDKKCESLIVSRLQKEFPSHEILTEEVGYISPSHQRGEGSLPANGVVVGGEGVYRWIIDPLDGTINYSHGYPLFATSIALEKAGEIILGVVYEPNRDELFTAEKGGGAELNGRRIKVSETKELKNSLLDTGFAYNVHEGERRNNLKHFGDFLLKAQAIRRDGVAASDLCYVACGRFDGFWELFLKPWDIAAGQLIIKEAGGMVTSFNGSPLDVYGNEILASNGKIHDEMKEVLLRSSAGL